MSEHSHQAERDPLSADILKAQNAVAEEYIADEGFFLSAVGSLMDALMVDAGDPNWCNKFPVFVDGIIIELADRQAKRFIGRGTAIMLGNDTYVEPISLELHFDRDACSLVRAKIRFGIADSRGPLYGGSEAKKIAQSVVAKAQGVRRKRPFDWRYHFEFKDGAWRTRTRSDGAAAT